MQTICLTYDYNSAFYLLDVFEWLVAKMIVVIYYIYLRLFRIYYKIIVVGDWSHPKSKLYK
jgi:hypothetical protein